MTEQRPDPKEGGLDSKIPVGPAGLEPGQPDLPPETPPPDPVTDKALADTFPASDPVSVVTDEG